MKELIFKVVKNKYIIAIIGFVVLIVLIDDNSIIMSAKLYNQLKKLEDKKEFYLSEIKTDSINTVDLKKDIKKIEQYGREEYLMKRKNEDLFIIRKE